MPAGESSPLNRADIPHRDSADLINKTEIPTLYHHNNEPTWAGGACHTSLSLKNISLLNSSHPSSDFTPVDPHPPSPLIHYSQINVRN